MDIKLFNQLGFIEQGSASKEIFGRCPFCYRDKKFYIASDSGLWDCKVCGKKGNPVSFIEQFYNHSRQFFTEEIRQKLADSRGISAKTFDLFGIAYDPNHGQYLLPIYKFDGKHISNLKLFSPRSKTFIGLAGRPASLFGHAHIFNDLLKTKEKTVYLCEGEWDAIAMHEIITQNEIENVVVLGAPSAGTFKPEWIQYIREHDVNIMYDADVAGKAGGLRVFNMLKPECKKVQVLHWLQKDDFRPDLREGYDVRDCFKELGAVEAFNYLRKHLFDVPVGAEISEEEIEIKESFTKLNIEEIRIAYKKWLHLPDTSIIDFIYAVCIANRMEGDPLWAFMVAPSGGTKTELCMSLSDAKCIECISTLTSKTLVSGTAMGGTDPSLIPKLNGKILVVKDFTTILTANPLEREAIFGVLRDAYDGEFTKGFGNGITRKYKSKFGIIAGVTPAIEKYVEDNAALGERFIRYKMPLGKTREARLEYLRRAVANTNQENGMRAELRIMSKQVLAAKYENTIVIPQEIGDAILSAAQWLATIRGVVTRDKFSKDVLHKPFIELGTRVAKQLNKLLIGICLIRGIEKATQEELDIILRCARDTAPTMPEELVALIHKQGRALTGNECAEAIRMPSIITGRVLEDLTMVGALKKERVNALQYQFNLHDEFAEVIQLSNIYGGAI